MLFDTDVLIFAYKGDDEAARAIDQASIRSVSVQTVMEFLQGSLNADNQRILKQFLVDYDFTVMPLDEDVGHRALVYIEEYALSHGLRAGDALIAATAVENAQPLLTANVRHFRPIKELDLHVFKPRR